MGLGGMGLLVVGLRQEIVLTKKQSVVSHAIAMGFSSTSSTEGTCESLPITRAASRSAVVPSSTSMPGCVRSQARMLLSQAKPNELGDVRWSCATALEGAVFVSNTKKEFRQIAELLNKENGSPRFIGFR
jgi:hypothetical protein